MCPNTSTPSPYLCEVIWGCSQSKFVNYYIDIVLRHTGWPAEWTRNYTLAFHPAVQLYFLLWGHSFKESWVQDSFPTFSASPLAFVNHSHFCFHLDYLWVEINHQVLSLLCFIFIFYHCTCYHPRAHPQTAGPYSCSFTMSLPTPPPPCRQSLGLIPSQAKGIPQSNDTHP